MNQELNESQINVLKAIAAMPKVKTVEFDRRQVNALERRGLVSFAKDGIITKVTKAGKKALAKLD